MNIRAKLADQYDIQFGPYNPFKVNPPPKPFWVDDRFDLVPEGVQVPDDFYPGFMKPDPETLRRKFLFTRLKRLEYLTRIGVFNIRVTIVP